MLIWPGELFLLVRMGYRAVTRPQTHSLMLARGALGVLFFSNAIAAAQHWHRPFTWTVTPFVVVACILVACSRDL